MSTKNRGDRITLLHKAVSKNFTPLLAPEDRSVLEHMLYACCLEDASYEAADEAFSRLQASFIDWNEVRVTTISELRETLQSLPDPSAASVRIKKNLQSIFETRYSFALDDMIKMNQGKAIQELEKLSGMSRFVLAYTTQNALGGHAIPVSGNIMQVLLATEIVSDAEAAKGLAPGLERTIPKTKGAEFSSGLHQLGLMLAQSPGGKQTKAILSEAGVSDSKKAVAKPSSAGSTKKTATKKTAKTAAEAAAPAAKPPAAKKAAKKKTAAKFVAKKAPKKEDTKAAAKKSTAKSSAAKRKPR